MAIADGFVGNRPSLSDVLFDAGTRDFRSFATVPSNVEAAEAAVHFSRKLVPFVALIGPSGWGKTHLLESALSGFQPRERLRVSAADWLRDAGRENPYALALDDVQEVLAKTRSRIHLRLALERRLRAGKPTILALSSDQTGRSLRTFLPSLNEWILARIETPDPEEREMVLRHLAAQDGLNLSPVLPRVLARRVVGNGRSLSGALKRLRLYGKDWETPDAALRACGLLQPFFGDDDACSLQDQIMIEAQRTEQKRYSAGEVAAYMMQRVAGLSEADASRFLEIRPSDAYTAAARVAAGTCADPELAEELRIAVERVLDRLADS
jgi:hypothetical protein